MQQRTLVGSSLRAIAHVFAASAVGLIALPLLFNSGLETSGPRAWIWLAGSVVVSLWLLLPAPVLVRALAQVLNRLPGQSRHHGAPRSPTFDVSRRLLAIAYVVLLQAVVRRPLVAALAPATESLGVEGVIAVLALLLLLVIMALLHQVGKPLVEELARFGLDAVVATSGSEALVAAPQAPAGPAAASELATAANGAEQTLAAPTQTAASRPREQRRSIA